MMIQIYFDCKVFALMYVKKCYSITFLSDLIRISCILRFCLYQPILFNMKKLICVFIVLLCGYFGYAQDLMAYTTETSKLIREGKYAEALPRCEWFHNNALKINNDMRGVRLSFALSDWYKLGELYPPAMESFHKAKDQTFKQFQNNTSDVQSVRDLFGFYSVLGEEYKSVALLESFVKDNTGNLHMYWNPLKMQLFEFKRYDLISEFKIDVLKEYAHIEESHLTSKESMAAEFKKRQLNYPYNNDYLFVEQSVGLIQYALYIKDIDMAKQIQKSALKISNNPKIQNAIQG